MREDEKMKKQNFGLLLTGFLIAGMILLSGCNNVLSPSANNTGAGQGNVTVSFSAGLSGRTLMPSALDFDSYDFTFKKSGYTGTFTVEKGTDASFTFSVPEGSAYTLDVKAYKGSGEDKVLAAEGESTEPFVVNTSTSVTVKLRGNLNPGETGTFSYNIQYPDGAQIDRFVLIGDDGEIDLLAGAEETTAGAGKAMVYAKEVTAGWYGLELDLSDGEKAAYDDDIVAIYSDTTTFYGSTAKPIVFAAEDFKVPPVTPPVPDENVGVPTNNWHDFIVEGPDNLYKSGAVGIQYTTFTDNSGTYTDVLKLEPPDGHYAESTMALSYTVPSDGYYKLSMSIMAEAWPGNGINIFWQQIDGDWLTVTGDLNKIQGVQEGQWFVVSTSNPQGVYLHEGDVFALLTRQNDNPGNSISNGLNDAVIYIKDLRLEKDGAAIVDTSVGDGHVYGVTVSPETLNISVGQNRTLTAQVFPSDADNKNVSWSSSDSNIATVDTNGLVTAVAAGSAVITVTTAEGGYSATSFVTVYEEGYVEPKYLALTFDDGPDASATPRLLEILAKYHVHATFFLVGNNVAANPDVARAIRDGGHDLGNHSLTHRADYYDISDPSYNPLTPMEVFKQELIDTQDIIKRETGVTPVFFRTPHTSENENLRLAAEAVGLPRMWCKMFTDWEAGTPPETIYQRTIGEAWDWGIFDLHDCGPNCENTVSAIDDILNNLINNEGYTVVSLSEMLAARKALYLNPGQRYDDFANIPPDPAFPADGNIVRATGITVPDDVINLDAGDTRQLTATVTPNNTTRSKVFWYSENDSVASVGSNGLVTANRNGTTTIRAVADGQMAVVTVNVTGTQVDEWSAFSYGGADFSPSGAVGDIGSWEGYSNVLRLALPGEPVQGTTAMTYVLPAGGECSLSMDVWVQKRTYQDIQIHWEETGAWHPISENNEPVTEGSWIHIETSVSNSWNLPAGDIIYLLIKNGSDYGAEGIKDAVLYIRDLKLEIGGQTILNIPSGAYDPNTAFDDNIFGAAWAAFDYGGNLYTAGPSGAEGDVVKFTDGFGVTYSNVLRLAVPEGTPVPPQTVAMTCVLPDAGRYTMSMDIWVEKRTYQDIQILWQEAQGDWRYISENSDPVTEGKWIHIETPEPGYLDFQPNTLIYLLVANVVKNGDNKPIDKDGAVTDVPGEMILQDGIKDAVLYIRDMEVTLNGNPIIYCPSTVVP